MVRDSDEMALTSRHLKFFSVLFDIIAKPKVESGVGCLDLAGALELFIFCYGRRQFESRSKHVRKCMRETVEGKRY